jgi:hypothetical protein
VTGTGCGASFTWNQTQAVGAAGATDSLVLNGCSYGGTSFSTGTVNPINTTTYAPYTVYDFVTWVNDGNCGTAGGCQTTYSYKRVTVEVTSSGSSRVTPTRAVLVSAIVADPHAAPNVSLNQSNPLVTCDPAVPPSSPCNYGLDGQTANIFYLTDSSEQSAIQTTGTTAVGVNVITNMGTTTNVQVGMAIAGPGIPSGATVTSVDSSSQVHISASATAVGVSVPLAIGPTSGVQTTGNTTNGSNVITGMATTTGVQAPTAGKTLGMYISGAGIPTGTTVTSVDSSSQVHISNNATATATGVSLGIGPYQPRAGDNGCMRYTVQTRPLSSSGSLSCGGTTSAYSCSASVSATTTPNACPQPDLLFPAASTGVSQEYNFSPNLSQNTPGRVIKRDPSSSVTSCSVTPSSDATAGEFWATQPLSAPLNLTGFGGMTLYTSTLTGNSQNVTLCLGFYLETPVSTAVGAFLDPLNLLCGNGCTTDSKPLGTVSYSLTQWPATITPLSFTFNYMTANQTVPAGSSIGMRMWVTNNSGDDLVVNYDAPSSASDVELLSK